MFHAELSDTISGEMIQCSGSKTKQEVDARADTDEVKVLAKPLYAKIREAKSLQNITTPRKPSPYWTLLKNTSWKIVSPKFEQVKAICAVALNETEDVVLQARDRLLSTKHAMALRFDLWLTINLWVQWNKTALPGAERGFEWWDQCEDQVVDDQGLYWGQTAEKVGKLMIEDKRLLKELGDFLTRFPGLVNNRDAPPSRRVVSIGAKTVIDEILKVSCNGRWHLETF